MSTRSKILIAAAVLLLGVRIFWGYFGSRGLITIHADKQPLAEVTRSIGRQAGTLLQANFDPATPVTMHVEKVPLGEALGRLSAVTGSAWELAYVAAPNRGTGLGLLEQIGRGEKPESWVRLRRPIPRILAGSEDAAMIDPRRDWWEIKPPTETTLRAYFEQAAENVDAAFLLPSDWNPSISKPPSADEITDLAPKLAKKAGGKVIEVFLLTRFDAEKKAAVAEKGEKPAALSPEQMQKVMDSQIAKLPPEKQVEAKAKAEEKLRMMKEMSGMTEAEKKEKMADYFSRPDVLERIDDSWAAHESRQTPEQRRDRYESYIQNRAQAKGGR